MEQSGYGGASQHASKRPADYAHRDAGADPAIRMTPHRTGRGCWSWESLPSPVLAPLPLLFPETVPF
ncbi:hypothetical protein [Nonomuraea sp. NPDC005650]|uniref:hypothetical protein n=1 Tax=Nonomuraea sp. NPDC005650 TaxID=3157045 RepID=UPI0033B5AFBB